MSEHYTDGRRWSYISQAWIFADGWNDREEIARLEAKVRELEERLGEVEAGRECVHIDEYQALQDRVHELEDKLRQAVDEGRAISRLNVEQAVEIGSLKRRLQKADQERDQLRARVGELEALNHKLNKALVFAEHGRTLERLQDSETQRALEGKEESRGVE